MTRRDPRHVGVPEGRLTLQESPSFLSSASVVGESSQVGVGGGRVEVRGVSDMSGNRRPFTRIGEGCLGPRDSRGSDAAAGMGAQVTCPRRERRRGVRGTFGEEA
jgi:hypothetical protein